MAGKEEENIPLGDGETELEVVLEVSDKEAEKEAPAKEAEVEKKPEVAEQPERKPDGDDDKELEEYSEGVKKRINKLTYKARENERQRDEALNLARALKEENDNHKRMTVRKDMALANEYENRLKLQDRHVRAVLRAAIDAGDSDKQAECQAELSNLAVEFERVRSAKTNIEAVGRELGVAFSRKGEKGEEEAPEERRPQQQRRQEQQAPQIKPEPKAEEWASRNEWFGTDQRMTNTAFQIHESLVADEGFDPTSDEYYGELDKRMRAAFPHRFKDEAREEREERREPASRGQQTVAGARPSTVSTAKRNSVTLTKSQVAICKKLGITPEQYVRHLQKM